MKPALRVVASRHFAIPAEYVYDAWLHPEWIRRWMFGPDVRDERILRLNLDPRVGGKFSFVGGRRGEEVDRCGEYLELDRPGLLVFTWGMGDSRPAAGRVIVEIVPCAGGCEVTLTHVMPAGSADFGDEVAEVWRTMLAELANAFVEKTNPLILKAS